MEWSELYPQLYILPVKRSVIYPSMANTIQVSKELGYHLYEKSSKNDNFILAFTSKDDDTPDEGWSPDDLYEVGILAKIDFIDEKGSYVELKVRNLHRIKRLNWEQEDNLYSCSFEVHNDINDLDEEGQSVYMASIKAISADILGMLDGMDHLDQRIQEQTELGTLLHYVSQHLNLSRKEKQQILEMRSLKARTLHVLDEMVRHKESIKLQVELADRVSEQASKIHRENLLKEQMRAIQEELGDKGDGKSYDERIEKAHLPEHALKRAREEIRKLNSTSPGSPDAHIIQNYLDLILTLSWETPEPVDFELDRARAILDEDHFGLEKVKKRIIQHLAVMKRKKDKMGSILLLVGPPGVGKTSLGKSIAKALSRPFVRVSLGGVKDESEIRGHRRTYVGALPGRIIEGMKKAGASNPVFVLDEIDKLAQSYNGDPASALLEVLDPEQNDTFSDHFLEITYDLSKVFFIATANNLSSIPGPLLDRMELIQLSGYTDLEKESIAEKHLIKSVWTEHGLRDDEIDLPESVLKEIIQKYTREAGVRDLKRKLEGLSRYALEKILSHEEGTPFKVTVDHLPKALGREVYIPNVSGLNNPAGVVTGLAWTPVGGDILFIEANASLGKGGMTITGQLGDVMKESAQIALSVARSGPLAESMNLYLDKNIHLHVPNGSVPKDGPSAGIAMFSAFVSLFLNKKVDPKLAMTGEVTLSGRVLPIGGVKEKLIAAHRSGIQRIILPAKNKKDLKDLPSEVLNALKISFAENTKDVLKIVFGIENNGVELPLFMRGDDYPKRSDIV
ncbi:endopeptidase La [Spirochaeta cellobiosiphila]|uniref:endopeptidase La n=1 Tax=Spirochaeta cellobiosiphila TaxID=504483 RepID=UPI0003FC86FD|nr:endopeptidase La [Spirochaeta cellobiosiphila]